MTSSGQRPTIMITNDDGINSPGLIASIQALMGLGELLVVAPASQQSSTGRSFGDGPGRGAITEVKLAVDGVDVRAYSVVGPPALVVAHALTEIATKPPSLCVSGINLGENLGRDVQGSGTVGAAFEAEAYGVPAVAISLAMSQSTQQGSDFSDVEWGAASYVTRRIARRVLTMGLPSRAALLNINVPTRLSTPLRWRITRQSAKRYYRAVSPGSRNWLQSCELDWAVLEDFDEVEHDSDIWAVVHDGVVSVTPMTWDQTVWSEWDSEEFIDDE